MPRAARIFCENTCVSVFDIGILLGGRLGGLDRNTEGRVMRLNGEKPLFEALERLWREQDSLLKFAFFCAMIAGIGIFISLRLSDGVFDEAFFAAAIVPFAILTALATILAASEILIHSESGNSLAKALKRLWGEAADADNEILARSAVAAPLIGLFYAVMIGLFDVVGGIFTGESLASAGHRFFNDDLIGWLLFHRTAQSMAFVVSLLMWPILAFVELRYFSDRRGDATIFGEKAPILNQIVAPVLVFARSMSPVLLCLGAILIGLIALDLFDLKDAKAFATALIPVYSALNLEGFAGYLVRLVLFLLFVLAVVSFILLGREKLPRNKPSHVD